MATYGLMADYAVGEALDALDDVDAQVAAAQADADAIVMDIDEADEDDQP